MNIYQIKTSHTYPKNRPFCVEASNLRELEEKVKNEYGSYVEVTEIKLISKKESIL